MTAQSFTIAVPQETLDDLRERLARTRWTDEVAGSGWEYGIALSYVKELVDHWQQRYDWRKHEAALNEPPQFLCEVDGVDLHFWHVRGKGPSPMPLLLVHQSGHRPHNQRDQSGCRIGHRLLPQPFRCDTRILTEKYDNS